jgi:hypothetical protein
MKTELLTITDNGRISRIPRTPYYLADGNVAWGYCDAVKAIEPETCIAPNPAPCTDAGVDECNTESAEHTLDILQRIEWGELLVCAPSWNTVPVWNITAPKPTPTNEEIDAEINARLAAAGLLPVPFLLLGTLAITL